jgi:L-fuculose-phosphate aldolase
MAASEEAGARQAMIDACLKMNHTGINQGTAGNLSVRWKNGLLITPSGVPYDEMTVDDIVFMDMDGNYQHRLAASSEWRFHRDILQARGEVNAVVHAHPIHATAFAICGMEIPAVHYMIAAAGGPTIRCAPYETYGTEELSKAVLEALSGRTCTLIANHGMIATGPASNMHLPFKSESRVCLKPRRSTRQSKNSRSTACGGSRARHRIL